MPAPVNTLFDCKSPLLQLQKCHSQRGPLVRYFSNSIPKHQPRKRLPAAYAGPANPVKPFLANLGTFPHNYIFPSQLTISRNPATMKGSPQCPLPKLA